jgi:broad specificity phosphatase PhoE
MLVIIRHAQSAANARGVTQGSAMDTPLTAQGRDEAKRTAQFLHKRGIRPTRIIASPARRTMETAAAISTKFGIPVVDDALLVETGKGKISSMTQSQISAEYAKIPELAGMAKRFDKMDAIDFAFNAPEVLVFDKIQEKKLAIESNLAIARRIREFMSKVPKTGTTVVVTHNGWIGAFMAHQFNTYSPIQCNLGKTTRNCHISVVHFVNKRAILSLDRYNLHLD